MALRWLDIMLSDLGFLFTMVGCRTIFDNLPHRQITNIWDDYLQSDDVEIT
jgi:hypothetical protein